MDEPRWITFYTAADKIRKRFDCGWAEAKARLRSACKDTKIVSNKAPYNPDELAEQGGLIEPRECWSDVAHRQWREREVDEDDVGLLQTMASQGQPRARPVAQLLEPR